MSGIKNLAFLVTHHLRGLGAFWALEISSPADALTRGSDRS